MSAQFTITIGDRSFDLHTLSTQKLLAWGTALTYHGQKLQRICANPGKRTPQDVEYEIREACVKILHRYDSAKFTRQALKRATIEQMKNAVMRLRDMHRSALERN